MGTPRRKEEKTVSSFEAKTHLAQLISQAENGESIVITRRGKPVARIMPFLPRQTADFAALATRLKAFRSKIRGPVNVLELRDAGRKY